MRYLVFQKHLFLISPIDFFFLFPTFMFPFFLSSAAVCIFILLRLFHSQACKILYILIVHSYTGSVEYYSSALIFIERCEKYSALLDVRVNKKKKLLTLTCITFGDEN